MRRVFIGTLSGLAICSALSSAVLASSPDPADFPLRVHIVHYVSQVRNRHEAESQKLSDAPDYIDGQGYADLFQNGQPQGFQFRNSCTDPLRVSGGYATFPARWKKAARTLEILLPREGKSWNMVTCDLAVELRPGLAYFWNVDDDSVVEEASAVFKAWMVKHQYDPERDLNDPIDVAPASAEPAPAGWSSSQQTGPQ
jgi:hypothetical protein